MGCSHELRLFEGQVQFFLFLAQPSFDLGGSLIIAYNSYFFDDVPIGLKGVVVDLLHTVYVLVHLSR
jgi:hypothetical protein